MKKVLVLFVALMAITFAASAQKDDKKGNPPEKPTAAQMTEKMAEELSLTADQKAKVLSLNEEYADYIGGPHHGGPKPPEMKDGQKPEKPADGQKPELTDEQKAEMEANKAKHEEYETKLKAILTEEQISTMEANKKNHHGPEGKGPKADK